MTARIVASEHLLTTLHHICHSLFEHSIGFGVTGVDEDATALPSDSYLHVKFKKILFCRRRGSALWTQPAREGNPCRCPTSDPWPACEVLHPHRTLTAPYPSDQREMAVGAVRSS